MNWKNIIKYIYFIIILWTIPFLVNFIVEKLNGDKGDPMFFTIIFLLFGVNIAFAHINAKCKWCKKIVLALIIVALSIFLSALLVRLDILPFYDPYGIMAMDFWKWNFHSGFMENNFSDKSITRNIKHYRQQLLQRIWAIGLMESLFYILNDLANPKNGLI